ncbi:MAG: heat-inducible transcriptional repressor HrcA [Acidaminococcus sp.]|jgi:heat-inducible transcriptional repressor|nr:heat-inducible transcriptional repressor HrcA [Acidaminococcus sp.]MCI2115995.1 heat-inducible transcriptional repressor HrcA [Acidaminococcus sp.]
MITVLTDRQKKILQLIIDDYIETAEPVGSRTIARKYNLGISPATIRNEMSDLELLGYLEQPHTSAGRVPSAAAYRLYVDSLAGPLMLSPNDVALINSLYRERVHTIDDIFQSTAKILSRMSKNVSVVLANKDSDCVFSYMRFLPLNEHQAILCIVTEEGNVDHGVIQIPAGMTSLELEQLAERVTNKLNGKKLSEIDSSLLTDLRNSVARDDRLYSSIIKGIKKVQDSQSENKMFLGGTKQILNQPEFKEPERMKELLGVLEEEQILKDMLMAGKNSGLKVTIGSENKFSGIKDCSMIQATYRLNGQVVGTLAVLGPTRMEYRKVISVMEYLHHYLKVVMKKIDEK